MDEHPTDIEQAIRTTGLRCTAQRVAVLRALRSGGHRPVGEVASAVAAELGTVSVQAVYDALDALTAAGLATRVEPPGSPALYEATTTPHHHVVCRRCGALADVELAGRPRLAPLDPHGFEVDGLDLTFWGLCPSCQASHAGHPTPHEETTP